MYFASAALALGSGDDDIHPPATALGTDEPPTPIEHGRVRAVSSNHLDGVGLDLWPHVLHHTINPTFAFAALPSVIGGPVVIS
jgi:hypothetical protein